MDETELKFALDPQRAAAVGQALVAAGASTAAVQSHYHDSADRRLARAGLSLRLRQAHGTWEQTLKAPGRHAVSRHEHTVPRHGDWPPQGPPVDPRLHAGSAAGQALQTALRHGRGRPHGRHGVGGAACVALLPVYSSVVDRCTLSVAWAGASVEIAFDRGELRAGDRTVPICEVEYELKRGSPRALAELGRAGVLAHGMWLSTLSKSARGDQLRHGDAAPPAVKARPPQLQPQLHSTALLQALLKACLDQVLPNASAVAAGHRTGDLVHQLRVGLRRLRTLARELSGIPAAPPHRWEAPVADVFRALGAWRDQHSVAPQLQAQLAAAGSPAPALLAAAPEQAAVDPVAVVRGPDFQDALLNMVAITLLPQPRSAAGLAPGPLRRHIAKRLRKLHARLQHSAAGFHRLDDARRHQARKRLKRLRYLVELTGPLFKAAQVKRYLHALKPAQDALGDYMDLVAGLRMAQGASGAEPAAAGFNAGWLTAAKAAALESCCTALARAGSQAKPFWTAALR